MNIEYSKTFQKAVQRLSGKMLESVTSVILEVREAESVKDITDCKKLTGYDNIYRIRIGDLRAFFLLYIIVSDDEKEALEIDDTVFFQYLVSRGQAYSKKIEDNLRKLDRE